MQIYSTTLNIKEKWCGNCILSANTWHITHVTCQLTHDTWHMSSSYWFVSLTEVKSVSAGDCTGITNNMDNCNEDTTPVTGDFKFVYAECLTPEVTSLNANQGPFDNSVELEGLGKCFHLFLI